MKMKKKIAKNERIKVVNGGDAKDDDDDDSRLGGRLTNTRTLGGPFEGRDS
jgi:hypothetical protein